MRLKVSKEILSKVIKMLTLFVLLSEDAFFKMLNDMVIDQLVQVCNQSLANCMHRYGRIEDI